MKKLITTLVITSSFLLNVSLSYAGLDWTYGSLNNADNLERYAESVAYSSSGNIFVSGVEENSLHNTLIVTKKFSSAGTLLGSVTNSYLIPTGTHVHDICAEIKTDASDNVYVLGKQYGSTSRGYDVVLIKYNSSLMQQWKKLIYNTNQPNNFVDKPCKILLDANNNVYVTGTWNNVTITGFTEEIFVQKYGTTGTLLYSATVPQASGKTIKDVSDMCIDNNLNVTVCAQAKDGNNVYSIMYARITNTGSLGWKKFYSPNYAFNYLTEPQIECLTTGTLYIATQASREPAPSDKYTKNAIVKFTTSGTQLWENLSVEIHDGNFGIVLRLDASNNIYAGSDYGNSSNYRHSIYKLDAAGTLQWIHTSAERSSNMNFNTYNSTSLTVAYNRDPSGPNQFRYLKKIDCSTGNTIWTESIPFTPPANYGTAYVFFDDLSVNPATSEAVVISNLIGYQSGTNVLETRWCIQKYGATSPRMASSEINREKLNDENKFTVFPNPANNELTVSNLQFPAEVNIVNAVGQQVLYKHATTANLQLQTENLPGGIYFVQLLKASGIVNSQKIIIRH